MWATPVVREHLMLNVLCLILTMLLIALFFRMSKERPIAQVASLWFLIGFLPLFRTAILYHQNGFMLEPHWFVFSSIGFFLLLAYLITHYLADFKKILAVTIPLVLIWSGIAHSYNNLWFDQRTYCSYWIKKAPAFVVPRYFLYDSYALMGRDELNKIKEISLKKLEDFPKDSLALFELINTYLITKEPQKIQEYAHSLLESDNNAYDLLALGTILDRHNYFDLALESFSRSLLINPGYTDAYYARGVLFTKQGNFNVLKPLN
jgi:tetratricopeptide (TPR) repeat protein